MYTQRFLIGILAVAFKIEGAFLLEDYNHQFQCNFRTINGCIVAPEGAMQEAANLIRYKDAMVTYQDQKYLPPKTPSFEQREFTELSNINSWPNELIYCQCNLGACAANAIAFCLRYLSIRNSKNPQEFLNNPERLDPSRLYIYYNARFLEGAMWGTNSTTRDSGATIPGTILAIDKYGSCPENFVEDPKNPTNIIGYRGCIYDPKHYASQPSPESYRFAFDPSYCGLNTCSELSGDCKKNPYPNVSKYIRYTDLFSKYKTLGWLNGSQKREIIKDFKEALRNNMPIFFGFALDKNYEQQSNGFIPLPDLTRFTATSGHAVAIIGYGNYSQTRPEQKYFKFINSHGPSWGHGGYGYLPEEYITNPNVFSRGCYAVDLPKVTVTITKTVSRSVPKLLEPSPIIKEMDEYLEKKSEKKDEVKAAQTAA